MRLEIKDFARIKEANINLGEITVIAGKNDTGKSTISKILYSLINGLSEEGREKFKGYHTKNQIDEITFELYKKTLDIKFRDNKSSFKNELLSIDNILNLIQEIEKEENYSLYEEKEKILEIKNISINDEFLKNNTIITYFYGEFGENFKSTFDNSEFELTVKVKEKRLTYIKKPKKLIKEELIKEIKMTPFRNAIYLESPFTHGTGSKFFHTQMVNDLIKQQQSAIFLSEIQEDIINEINQIIDGNYIVENFEFYLERDGIKIRNQNVATGIKSLGQIKLLLEKGILKKDSFLILDEPEVHLHPEWQVKLAQIIGLLNRKLEIKILINTHSSYFVEAIDVFKDYYKIDDVNYYLVELEEEGSKFKEVTDDISQIYSSLSQKAYDMLDEFKSKVYFEEQEDVK